MIKPANDVRRPATAQRKFADSETPDVTEALRRIVRALARDLAAEHSSAPGDHPNDGGFDEGN